MGVIINLQFKLIFPFLLQLPHLVFWSLITTLQGAALSCTEYSSSLSLTISAKRCLYHFTNASFIACFLLSSDNPLDIYTVIVSSRISTSGLHKSFSTIIRLYSFPRYRSFSPWTNCLFINFEFLSDISFTFFIIQSAFFCTTSQICLSLTYKGACTFTSPFMSTIIPMFSFWF